MAWDQPDTRACYAGYQLGALRWTAGGLGGIGLAIGLSVYAVTVLQRPGLGVFIVGAALLGVIALVAGVGGLLRAQRFQVALRTRPWHTARLRVAGSHLRLVFGQDDDDSPRVDARLMTTSWWRVREVVGLRDAEVRVCHLDPNALVLTAPGLDNLYGVRSLTRKAGRDRP